jgi:integrase/recombinase XerD
VCAVDHGLRVIQGQPVLLEKLPVDLVRFRLECFDAFITSWVVRGFSPVTIENDSGGRSVTGQ